MSMLTTQVDKLRERAEVLRQGRWTDSADDAAMMDEAADAIEALRERAQAAAPGSGECRYVDGAGLLGSCSECGEPMGNACKFCCECGRKVKR